MISPLIRNETFTNHKQRVIGKIFIFIKNLSGKIMHQYKIFILDLVTWYGELKYALVFLYSFTCFEVVF